jgi:hypothetical protein
VVIFCEKVSSIIDYGNPVWFLHIKVRKAYNPYII